MINDNFHIINQIGLCENHNEEWPRWFLVSVVVLW
jgi:hypothetical protein